MLSKLFRSMPKLTIKQPIALTYIGERRTDQILLP